MLSISAHEANSISLTDIPARQDNRGVNYSDQSDVYHIRCNLHTRLNFVILITRKSQVIIQ